jgi:hypothetical protein
MEQRALLLLLHLMARPEVVNISKCTCRVKGEIVWSRPNNASILVVYGGVFADKAHSIVSEREPGKHGHMRKYLSHAFSDLIKVSWPGRKL